MTKTKIEVRAEQIPGYSTYRVTEDGRVYSDRLRKGFLVPLYDKNGYVRFNLIGDNGKMKGVYGHQAVAATYLPNPDHKPFVNHLDHNKANNRVDNLRWCTHLENIQHDWSTGKRKAPPRGAANCNSKHPVVLIKQLRQLFDSGGYSQMELSRRFSIPFSTVHVIVKRKQWRVEL